MIMSKQIGEEGPKLPVLPHFLMKSPAEAKNNGREGMKAAIYKLCVSMWSPAWDSTHSWQDVKHQLHL